MTTNDLRAKVIEAVKTDALYCGVRAVEVWAEKFLDESAYAQTRTQCLSAIRAARRGGVGRFPVSCPNENAACVAQAALFLADMQDWEFYGDDAMKDMAQDQCVQALERRTNV